MFYDENNRAVIRIGDTTDHGGKVLTGEERMNIMGRPAARVGDMVICPKCDNKTYPIIEGNQKITSFDRQVAFDGHRTACGARLISSLGNTSHNNFASVMTSSLQNAVNNPPDIRHGVLTADASGINYLGANRRESDLNDEVKAAYVKLIDLIWEGSMQNNSIASINEEVIQTMQRVLEQIKTCSKQMIFPDMVFSFLYNPPGSWFEVVIAGVQNVLTGTVSGWIEVLLGDKTYNSCVKQAARLYKSEMQIALFGA